MKHKEVNREKVYGVAVFFMVLLSIGCSERGVFENPDSIKITTLEAIHGKTGHLVNFNISRNADGDDGETKKQVVLEIYDKEVSDATLYVVVESNNNGVGAMLDLFKNATEVAIVPKLPKNTRPWTQLRFSPDGNRGEAFAGYIRIIKPPATPVYLSLRGSLTQERIDWFLTGVRQPPEVIDTIPEVDVRATVVEAGYYRDRDFTEPIIDSVTVEDIIYTKIVFSKEVPFIAGADEAARPSIFFTVGAEESRYRIRAGEVGENSLQSGDAQLYRNAKDTFICKYIVQREDVGKTFSTHTGDPPVSAGLLHIAEPPEVIDMVPATVVEISYYSDINLTMPLIDKVLMGDTVYTKVVFSKEVAISFADSGHSQPSISSVVRSGEFQYRMQPRDTDDEHLLSGDAKPYQGTEHIFVCKYIVQTKDFGRTFRTYAGPNATSGGELQVTLFEHMGEIPPNTAETITDWQPDDFVGQIFTVQAPSTGNSSRNIKKPVAGATVTIASGPRSGESAVTDRNGRYRFLSVQEDELYLRTEREHFETKEVIVHRHHPTSLSDGSLPNYPRDPQKEPGNILIGQVWPEEVRGILEEVLVVHDLLYIEAGAPREGRSFGYYGSGIVFIHSTGINSPRELLRYFEHEIAHAHQHALVSPDGSGNIQHWINTPEGEAYA